MRYRIGRLPHPLSNLLHSSSVREVSRKRHVRADEYAIATGHRQTHALIVRVAQPYGKAASLHLRCEVENPKGLHAVLIDRVLVVDHANVTKPEGLDESLHSFVMRHWAVSFRRRRCGHQC